MRRSFHLAAALVLCTISSAFADDAYWVFFKDKGLGSDADYQQALAAASVTLSPQTLIRRDLRGTTATTVSYPDLPVWAPYASAIAATGAAIRTESTWVNAVSATLSSSQLATISQLGFVDHVQPVAKFDAIASVGDTTTIAAPAAAQGFYGAAQAQLDQIHITQVHALGYTGTGVTIGILDTGFKRTHEGYNYAGHPIAIAGEYNFIDGIVDTSSTANGQHTHGTETLGIIGGYKPNSYVGGAYNASFLLAKTEVVPTETQIEEDYWVAGLQWLENNGADVVTSSLGYIDWYSQAQLNGNTAVTTKAANIATALGLPIVNAAGNEGHDANPATSHLLAPADAFDLISVGAVDSAGNIASFSSDGPTADGRLKPEVLALGVGASLLDPNNDTSYITGNGTSFATPLVASAVALLIEAHPDWTVADIREALFSTATHYESPDPNYVTGYGIINAYAALEFPEPASLGLLAIGALALLTRRRLT